ncbi:catechol 2,3-dioxygenase-like lactoylglutathione lyase family enzyme [Bradyrhizobium sp. AZCC 1678]|uniref:VOC family protein n=1 Tax=Bradyrhizobium sp. AZCC 1678 TaxID=3117030 RepID=UPI002FEF4892
MDWSIHHINLPAHDVRESTRFYRDLIGLTDGPTPKTVGKGSGKFQRTERAFVCIGDGDRGLHIMKPMPNFASDNGFSVNPVISGHLAITVRDLDAVKRRLHAAGIFYADAGNFSMPEVRQIYVYDPSMNCIEINEVRSSHF